MELLGEKCRLRPFRVEDAGPIATIANNWNIARNLTSRFAHPYALEDAQSFIARSLDESMADGLFCIEVDGQPAGGIGCHRLDDAIHEHELDIGYWLAESCWGRGIATEAVGLLVNHVFKRFGVIRIQASVFGWNLASARVLEKNGFALEGRLRNAVKKGDEYCDMLVFGLLR